MEKLVKWEITLLAGVIYAGDQGLLKWFVKTVNAKMNMGRCKGTPGLTHVLL